MNPIKVTRVESIKSFNYLKSYCIHYETKTGKSAQWELASRQNQDRLENEIFKGKSYTDGAMIFAVNPDYDRVVLIKEFRVSAGRYLYTLPAGLIDEGESIQEAGIREFKEETGLELVPHHISPARYTSVGIINECVNVVYGTFSGTASKALQTEGEDAEIVIVDKQEAKRILEEEEITFRSGALLESFFGLNPFFARHHNK